LSWYRRLIAQKYDGSKNCKHPGRPKISQEIIDRVIQFKKENPRWGCQRRTEMFQLGLLLQLVLAGAGSHPAEFVNVERLSPRVIIAYWVGVDRRCNLTALQSQKGLVIIDTEECPRVMVPIKQKFEQLFGRRDWAYVINTHAHEGHCSGNSLSPGAVLVGHENLWSDMQWIIRRQTDPLKRDELKSIAQFVGNLQALLPRVARNPLQTRMVRGEIKFWELFAQDLYEGYPVVKPTLAFPDKYTLDLGDLTLELVYFGKGHSRCDIGIYVPQEKLLVSGGVVYQRAHVCLSGANGTALGACLSSCITGTYVPPAPQWHFAPSKATVGPSIGLGSSPQTSRRVPCQTISRSSMPPFHCSFEPPCSRRASRGGCASAA
jgi:glyoxylase-like metal-dependent hydrolase (beta-lactamase superfamily II)